MTISFSPGQGGQATTGTQAPVVPAEPVVPVISTNAPAAPAASQSPFAFHSRSKSKFGLYFQLVVLAVFSINVLSVIGLFVYQTMLSSELEDKKVVLTQKQSSFKKLPLEDMQKLSDRVAAVNQALKERASIRNALAILEYGIENPVTYKKFDLSYDEAKKNYTLNFSAVAPDYHSVIQQVDTLRNKVHSQYFSSLKVSKVTLDEKEGVINFTVDLVISLQGLLPAEIFQVEKITTKASSTPKTVASSTAALDASEAAKPRVSSSSPVTLTQ